MLVAQERCHCLSSAKQREVLNVLGSIGIDRRCARAACACAEQIVAVPVPLIMEDIVEVTQPVPFDRTGRVGEQIVAASVPQIKEDGVDVAMPQERLHRTQVDLPVPQIIEEIVAVARILLVQKVGREVLKEIKDIGQERHFERIAEQIIDVTVPRVTKEVVEVVTEAHHGGGWRWKVDPSGALSTTHCGKDRGHFATTDPGAEC